MEFAFCLPILLMMILGIVQFGWTQHQVSTVRFALARSSRALLIDPDLSQAQIQAMVSATVGPAAGTDLQVTLNKSITANGPTATLSTVYVASFGVPSMTPFNISIPITVTTALRPL
ncbi:MAG: TadE/TadG family type IV pilus assembly protein [Hyphomonadaceae bacterium]|nr:TadE/TadG family type IV pilus assembly protein [Hyphomonadaceae bacterium]